MFKTNFKAVLFTILILWFSNRTVSKVTDKVVNGRQTNIRHAPFMVQIWYKGSFLCGGTLISSTHVLTAAHCVKGRTRNKFRAHFGTGTLLRSGTVRRISRVFVPNVYNEKTKRKDAAVLKLSRAVNGTNIEPIGLCNVRIRAGLKLRLYGWGSRRESSSHSSNVLRTAITPVFAPKVCRRRYRRVQKITKSMFCAGIPGKTDSCYGDSGGPLIYNNRVCGIVSFGNGCARDGYPGVYTNVTMMRNFINRTLYL